VMPILIAIAWLNVVTVIVSACRVAARADAVEVEIDRTGLGGGTQRDASGDESLEKPCLR
jgi:hypothetical protein